MGVDLEIGYFMICILRFGDIDMGVGIQLKIIKISINRVISLDYETCGKLTRY